jgi:hypothetical protein
MNRTMTTNNRPSRIEMDDRFNSEPVFPAGDPAGWWTGEQLQAFIEAQTAKLAALEAVAELDMNTLTDDQLALLRDCTTREEVAEMLEAFAQKEGQPA